MMPSRLLQYLSCFSLRRWQRRHGPLGAPRGSILWSASDKHATFWVMPGSDSKRMHQMFLIGLGAAALAVCIYIARPFLPPLIAATALAILCYPVHLRLLRRLRSPNLTAAVSVLWVT